MIKPQDHTISKITGMFLDKQLEQQFLEAYFLRSENYLRKVVLVIGIVFFLFFFYDLFANKSNQVITLLLLCRIAFLSLSLFFYFKSAYFIRAQALLKMTFLELLWIILCLIVFFSHENPHFVIQASAVSVFVLAIFFLLPNIQKYRLFLAAITIFMFLFFSAVLYHPTFLELFSVLIYLSLCVFFSSLAAYSLGKYMRLDFVNNRYFLELSMKDPLTDAYNRLKFNESLNREIRLSQRYGRPLSLIMLDIDYFKQLNDKKGHIYGDKVLVELANLLKKAVREFDIFARWGGEEFVVLLPQTERQEAFTIAERLRGLISKENTEKEIDLTCSFGVTSLLPEDNEDSIMNRLDSALYKAKEKGRDKVILA